MARRGEPDPIERAKRDLRCYYQCVARDPEVEEELEELLDLELPETETGDDLKFLQEINAWLQLGILRLR